MAESRAYCRQALDEFKAELAQKAEQKWALEAERERLARPEAEKERQAALTETMEPLPAQPEPPPAQQPPPRRSRGFNMEP